MTTIYQEHYKLNQSQYDDVREQIVTQGGIAEYTYFEAPDGTFKPVGLTYQGVIYINKDNEVKQI